MILSIRLFYFFVLALFLSSILGARIDNATPLGLAIGRVTAVSLSNISVETGDGRRRFKVGENAKVWRRRPNVSVLAIQVGDNVDIRWEYRGSDLVAVSIDANSDRLAGQIVNVQGDGVEVSANQEVVSPSGYSRGIQLIKFSHDTKFVNCNEQDLAKGLHIEVNGYRVNPNTLDALQVTINVNHRPVHQKMQR